MLTVSVSSRIWSLVWKGLRPPSLVGLSHWGSDCPGQPQLAQESPDSPSIPFPVKSQHRLSLGL